MPLLLVLLLLLLLLVLVLAALVAYPAKDNYEGRMYPLDWIQQVGLCG
jgi:hypothetical protein